MFNPFFLLFTNRRRWERTLLEKLDHLCLSQCSHRMKIHRSGSLEFQEETSPVWINNPHFKQDYGYKWKTKSTSGYQFVTHLHTKAQPCFSPYPQLTPLPTALCGQTCTTLEKILKSGAERERQLPASQTGELSGASSAIRRLPPRQH